jgi:hypothetical protein
LIFDQPPNFEKKKEKGEITMSIIRNLMVVVLLVSIVCVRGAKAAENTGDSILAPPEIAISQQSADASFDALSWLISQFSAAVPTYESNFSCLRCGLKAPPIS